MTHFILSGTQVPWSPGTQAGYLSFQWSKRAGEKNLLYFEISSLIGTWSRVIWHILASGGQNEQNFEISNTNLILVTL